MNMWFLVSIIGLALIGMVAVIIVRKTRRRAEFERPIAQPARSIWSRYNKVLSVETVSWASGLDQDCEEESRSLRLAIELAQWLVEHKRHVSELDQILQEVPRARGVRTRCIEGQMFGSDPVYTNEDTTVEFSDPQAMEEILSAKDFPGKRGTG